MVNIDASTPQLKVLQKWLNAFDSLDANNLDPVLSKNYRHETFPKSIGLPEEGKEEHIERYKRTLPSLSKFGLTINELIEAPGKVVFHATTMCPTIYGTKINNDSFLIFSFVEEDGELKILRSKEFSDPQEYSTFYGDIAAAEKPAAAL